MREVSYDNVVYPGHAFDYTHPAALAARAWLRGLPVPDVASARVIELGCGDGGNVIPMAIALPGARFVGVDLAASAIARGRERVAELGLANVDLQVGDISTFTTAERYDFIIAHGVYSWLPEPVRRRLLELYAALLSPHGLGFLSFLAYPGGHFTALARGMVRLHMPRADAAAGLPEAARGFARALAEAGQDKDLYRAVMRAEAQKIASDSDASIAHDVLAAQNHYEWLVEMAAKLEALGLQYVADADQGPLLLLEGDPTAQRMLALAGDDPIMRAQYLDFAWLKRFRCMVLARAGVRPAARPLPGRLSALRLRCEVRPQDGTPSLARGEQAVFLDRYGAPLRLDDPLAKAAMLAMGAAFPRSLGFADIVAASVAAVRAAGADRDLEPDPTAHLAAALVELIGGHLVQVRTAAPRIASEPGERPRVLPYARTQLERDGCATNLWHENIDFDALGRRFIQLMDGTRDRATLAAEIGVDRAKVDAMVMALYRRSMLAEA